MLKDKTILIYEKLKMLIFTAFALYVGLREVTVLGFITGSGLITAGILLVGLAVIVCEILVTRDCFNNRKTDILFVFLAFTVLSCLINFRYGIGDNVKCVAEMVLFFFMLFPAGTVRNEKAKDGTFRMVGAGVSTLWLILSAVSVGTYLFGVEYFIEGGSWGVTSQGFSTEYCRLWGIYHDPNYAGYVGLAVIIFCLYLIGKYRKNAAAWIFGILNIAVQLTYISLSGSRSVLIIAVCVIFLYTMYGFYGNEKIKSVPANKIIPAALAAVTAAATAGVILGLGYVMPEVKKAADRLPESVGSAAVAFYDKLYSAPEITLLTREESESILSAPPEKAPEETTGDDLYDRLIGGILPENTTVNAQENTAVNEAQTPAAPTAPAANETKAPDAAAPAVTAAPTTVPPTTAAPTTVPAATVPAEQTTAAAQQEPTGNEEESTYGQNENRVKRTDLGGDISNGRFKRWQQTFEIFLKAPIFGTSPRNISAFAKDHNPDTLMAAYGIASHNGYLDVLVSTGIIGTAVFLLFFVTVLIAVIKKYFRFENDAEFITATAIAFCFALSVLFVSDLFFNITIGAFSFWYTLGYASGKAEEKTRCGILYRIADTLITKITALFGRK